MTVQLLPFFQSFPSPIFPADSSILIAMRSQVFPLPSSLPPDEFSLDLGLSLDIEPDQTDTYPTSREDCVEDSVIEFVEVQLRFDGLLLGQ